MPDTNSTFPSIHRLIIRFVDKDEAALARSQYPCPQPAPKSAVQSVAILTAHQTAMGNVCEEAVIRLRLGMTLP
jgi:hypothetical protein